jgi:hypothetical protein
MNAYSYRAETQECPYCDGSGGIPHTRMVCCGRPNGDGSCCGDGRPELELEQCQWCAENRPASSATGSAS